MQTFCGLDADTQIFWKWLKPREKRKKNVNYMIKFCLLFCQKYLLTAMAFL